MIEISVCTILETYNYDKHKDTTYKMTPGQAQFEDFVLNILKLNITDAGNLTPAGLFHLIDRLEVQTWRQLNREYNDLNSFERRVNSLILLLGFDLLVVAHHLKSNKQFTINNFIRDADEVEFVRVVYTKTTGIFKAAVTKIMQAIKTKQEEISVQAVAANSKLTTIRESAFFPEYIDNSAFIAATIEQTKQIIIEEKQLEELCSTLSRISYKLSLYNKKIDSLKVAVNPYKLYTFKKHYSEIDNICNTILSERKLIGDDADVLDAARLNFLKIYSLKFELIETPKDDELESKQNASVDEPKHVFLSSTRTIATPSSFFQNAEVTEDTVTLPNNGEFNEMELRQF